MALTLLAALALRFAVVEPTTINLVPTDTVWVYTHASDPATDQYLRAWGAEGKSVAPSATDNDSYSYSYLKFDLSQLPADKKLKSAKLTLTHIPGPGFTLDYAKANPLEARPVSANFTEKTWNYDDVTTIFPEADSAKRYGFGFPDSIPTDKVSFPIVIDLAKTDAFRDAVAKAIHGDSKVIALALTSTIDPSSGKQAIYKVYSAHGPAEKRPVLTLVFED